MYEEKNLEFDWKGFLLKLAFLIVAIVLVIKLLPIENQKTDKEPSMEFQNNMATLRTKSTDYFTGDKLPRDSKKVKLEDLIIVGAVNDLKDTNGNSCDKENSYVKVSSKEQGYEIEMFLICGKETDKSYVYITKEKETVTTTTTTTKKAVQTTKSSDNKPNTTKSVQNQTTKRIKTTKAATNVSVIFNSNGGTSVKTEYLQIGKTATRPINPIKPGYVFIGWYLGNKEYNFNTSVNSNTILIAKWAVKNQTTKKTTSTTTKKTTTTTKSTTRRATPQYTVTFDSNGGSYSSSVSVNYGSYVSKPSNPKKTGATFYGWYLDDELFDFNTRIYRSITLQAKYTYPETYTTNVYSAGYGSQLTTPVVKHTLKIPVALAHDDYINIRIKKVQYTKALSTSTDINNFYKYHKSTFDYQNTNGDYFNGIPDNLATFSKVLISKSNLYDIYDRGVEWAGFVSNQCQKTFNFGEGRNLCMYGIIYQVTWEYETIR